jgi:hypothetical protein
MVGAGAVFLFLAGCEPKDPRELYGKCVEVETLIDGQRRVTLRDESSGGEQVGQTVQPLYAASRTLWPVGDISVCWEDATYDAATETERGWVRDSIEKTWNKSLIEGAAALGTNAVKFTGFTRCDSSTTSKSIRIAVRDETNNPHVKMLGKWLKGYPEGMVLNFAFTQWSPVCKASERAREYCIRAIAVHEFGHALGMAHEQNRPDKPESCTDAPQGSNGDVLFGEWDLNSVMNYCVPVWNNGGRLSAADDFWVRVAYYPETISDAYCESVSNESIYDPIPELELPPELEGAIE